MYYRINLINVSVHPALGDHLTCDFLSFGGNYFQQSSKFIEGYVVVQFAGGQQVVLNDGTVQNSRTVNGASFLMRLQQSLEFLQLAASYYAIEIHFFQNGHSRQLLTSIRRKQFCNKTLIY